MFEDLDRIIINFQISFYTKCIYIIIDNTVFFLLILMSILHKSMVYFL